MMISDLLSELASLMEDLESQIPDLLQKFDVQGQYDRLREKIAKQQQFIASKRVEIDALPSDSPEAKKLQHIIDISRGGRRESERRLLELEKRLSDRPLNKNIIELLNTADPTHDKARFTPWLTTQYMNGEIPLQFTRDEEGNVTKVGF